MKINEIKGVEDMEEYFRQVGIDPNYGLAFGLRKIILDVIEFVNETSTRIEDLETTIREMKNGTSI